MKTAIIFADGLKQIVFTPENNDEKMALKLITPDDNIELAIKTGSIYDSKSKSLYAGDVKTCRGGYLRIFDGEESVMFVLKPNKHEVDKNDTPILDERFYRIFRWLLGYTVPEVGEFSPPPPTSMEDALPPPYWWRKNLRQHLAKLGITFQNDLT